MMVRLPRALDTMYGVFCLAIAGARSTPIRSQPLDALRPSQNVLSRSASASESVSDCLTLASWNVYEGRSENLILDGMETLLAEYFVDALTLQEIPRELALHPRLSSYHLLFAPTNYEGVARAKDGSITYGRVIGNAILSPHRLTSAAVIDLPVATWNYYGKTHVTRRNAIGANIAPGVDAWCAHLDLHCRPVRRAQQLMVAMEGMLARDADVSLLGMDANVIWTPFFAEPAQRVWQAHGYRDPWKGERRPFPAYVDQVLARGAKPTRGQVLDLPGSDHRALLATFVREK